MGHLKISSNEIRDDGATWLAQSLLPSAQSGSLKHLEIEDNFFTNDEGRTALFTLLREATNLKYIDCSSINIDKEEFGRELMSAIEQSQSKQTLKTFKWSYDANEMDDFIEEFLALLGDSDLFPKLEDIELAETMGNSNLRS